MTLDFSAPFTERTPRVSRAAKLHRAAVRKKEQRFLIEGENSVDAAVSTGAATDLFVTQSAAERFEHIVSTAGFMDVYIHPITDGAAKLLSETTTTPGIFAVCLPVMFSAGKIIKSSPFRMPLVQTASYSRETLLIRTPTKWRVHLRVHYSIHPWGEKQALTMYWASYARQICRSWRRPPMGR